MYNDRKEMQEKMRIIAFEKQQEARQKAHEEAASRQAASPSTGSGGGTLFWLFIIGFAIAMMM